MQLTKLLTLSQFIDSCEVSSEPCYHAIVKYNNFLKQPITKEMFVGNDAIFDGWEESIPDKIRIFHPNDIDFITFYGIHTESVFDGVDLDVKTLLDFASATNGTLTLKNVEI